jgi:hypothetical protein
MDYHTDFQLQKHEAEAFEALERYLPAAQHLVLSSCLQGIVPRGEHLQAVLQVAKLIMDRVNCTEIHEALFEIDSSLDELNLGLKKLR